MSGNKSRSKGKRGNLAAKMLLQSRDWLVSDLAEGISCEDLVATDPDGRTWSIEVKNTKNLMEAYIFQAKDQARRRKLPWMLMWHRPQSNNWFVMRQDKHDVVWGAF